MAANSNGGGGAHKLCGRSKSDAVLSLGKQRESASAVGIELKIE